MSRIAIPGLTVLIVVAALVGLSGWNRSAEPPQTIVVTERELPLAPTAGQARGDDPGLRLRLDVELRSDPLDSKNWLSEDRLRALGFSLDVPAGAPEADETYTRMPPRLGWVVLEFDGPAFQDLERRRRLRREAEAPRRPIEPSRLVPVDAGPEFEPLRARYSSQHFIVRAIIAINFLGPSSGGPLVFGYVREIVPSLITVPHRLRSLLDGLPERPPATADGPHTRHPPRYHAELATGPLGLVYLRALRAID